MRHLVIAIFFIILNSAVFSQTDNSILDQISKKFQRYCESFPREEIYTETDRDVYIGGERIWFNIWLSDRQKAALSGDSKIAYIEILNPVNRPVLQKKVGLDNGTGSGHFTLPDTLSSGVYTLRAYTNWMKNFMPDNCFSRSLKIYSISGTRNFFTTDELQKPGLRSDLVNNGISIRVNNDNKDFVEVSVLVNDEYRKKNTNKCYLFGQTRGLINYKAEIFLAGDTTTIKIPASQIIPGVNQFTVFSSEGDPVCETYSYTSKRREDLMPIGIITTDSCHSREQILLGINIGEFTATADSGILSVSIVPSGTKSPAGITDYQVFGSEFGLLPPVFMEECLDNIPDSVINDFLATTKSRWINWDLILSDQKPEIKYQKESRYHSLYGNMFSSYSNKALGQQNVFLSVTGKNATLQYSSIKPDGSFELHLPVDNKLRDLIIQADKQIEDNRIIFKSSFSDRYLESIQSHSNDSVTDLIREMKLNYRVMRVYKSFEPRIEKGQEILTDGTRRFYGKPDIELRMADYILLPTMQEVFFELIPGVSIKSENKKSQITIRDPADSRIYNDPLLLIDGVIIRDPAVIAGMDPQLVKKIDIIKSKYVFGDIVFSGLINVITNKGDLENLPLPADASRIQYRAFEAPEKFGSPDYTSSAAKLNHIPDLRNTLYWNTLHVSGSDKSINLVFSASDFLSDYTIRIQGATKKGILFSQDKKIRIVK
jgi:hypothetical protein